MRNAERRTRLAEAILTVFILSFSLLKAAYHVPFENILFFMLMSAWAVFYIALGIFRFGYPLRKESDNSRALSILTGFSIALWILAVLFDSLRLPFSGFFILLGIACMLLSGISALFLYRKKRDPLFASLFIRTFLYTALGIILFSLPRTFSLELFYREHPGYIKAVKKVMENPEDTAARKQLEQETKWLEEGQK
ncbi:MAG: LPXTG cell wall anchor domain-containing protein [Flavobacteriales bacterium]